MPQEAARLLFERRLPKGDALLLAQVAGIQGAKKAADLLPLCHPLPLDRVHVDCRPLEDGVEVRCEVKCTARTGVEMEALAGVSAALLCLWDLLKPVTQDLELHGVLLLLKEGGASGSWRHPRAQALFDAGAMGA